MILLDGPDLITRSQKRKWALPEERHSPASLQGASCRAVGRAVRGWGVGNCGCPLAPECSRLLRASTKAGTSVLKSKGAKFGQQPAGAWRETPAPQMNAPWSPPDCSLVRSCTQNPVKMDQTPDSGTLWEHNVVYESRSLWSRILSNRKRMHSFFLFLWQLPLIFQVWALRSLPSRSLPCPIYFSDSFLLPTSTAITSGITFSHLHVPNPVNMNAEAQRGK